jgi:hypothetical protein
MVSCREAGVVVSRDKGRLRLGVVAAACWRREGLSRGGPDGHLVVHCGLWLEGPKPVIALRSKA